MERTHMLRIIIGLALVLELASTAFAYKIHNGKLIEHRESITGNGVLQVNESDQAKPDKLNFKEMKNEDFAENKNGILLINKVFEKTGVIGSETIIDGYLNVYIENFNSATPKTYKFYSNFCLGLNCAKNSYEILLNPGGYFELQTKPAITYNFDAPGHYKVYIASLVDSEDLTNVFATYDAGYINIEE